MTANKYRLGVFFSISSLAFIIVIIWLTGGFGEQAQDKYVSYFSWSVQGLSQGSNVMYNGVPIGKVRKIEVAPDGRLVEVQMTINQSFNMDSTIVATMQLTGITGLQVMNLTSDTLNAAVAPSYSFTPPYPVIPVGEGAFQTVTTTLSRMAEIIHEVDFGGISTQIEDLLTNLNAIFDSDMIENIEEAILQNTANLDTLLIVYTDLGRNLNRFSLQLEVMAPEFLSEMDSLGGTLNEFSTQLQTFMQSMDEIMIEGSDALRSLSDFLEILSIDPGGLLLPTIREGVWR